MTLFYACKTGKFVRVVVADVMTYVPAARCRVLLDSIEQPLFESNACRVERTGAIVLRVKGTPLKLLCEEYEYMYRSENRSSKYDFVHSVYVPCESANVNARLYTQNAIYAYTCAGVPLLKRCLCKNS